MRFLAKLLTIIKLTARLSCNNNNRRYTSLVKTLQGPKYDQIKRIYSREISNTANRGESLKEISLNEMSAGTCSILPVALIDLGNINSKTSKVLIIPLNWQNADENILRHTIKSIFSKPQNLKQIEAFSAALNEVSENRTSEECILDKPENETENKNNLSFVNSFSVSDSQEALAVLLDNTLRQCCLQSMQIFVDNHIIAERIKPCMSLPLYLESGSSESRSSEGNIDPLYLMNLKRPKLNLSEITWHANIPFPEIQSSLLTNPIVHMSTIAKPFSTKTSDDSHAFKTRPNSSSKVSCSKCNPNYDFPYLSKLFGTKELLLKCNAYNEALIEAEKRRAALDKCQGLSKKSNPNESVRPQVRGMLRSKDSKELHVKDSLKYKVPEASSLSTHCWIQEHDQVSEKKQVPKVSFRPDLLAQIQAKGDGCKKEDPCKPNEHPDPCKDEMEKLERRKEMDRKKNQKKFPSGCVSPKCKKEDPCSKSSTKTRASNLTFAKKTDIKTNKNKPQCGKAMDSLSYKVPKAISLSSHCWIQEQDKVFEDKQAQDSLNYQVPKVSFRPDLLVQIQVKGDGCKKDDPCKPNECPDPCKDEMEKLEHQKEMDRKKNQNKFPSGCVSPKCKKEDPCSKSLPKKKASNLALPMELAKKTPKNQPQCGKAKEKGKKQKENKCYDDPPPYKPKCNEDPCKTDGSCRDKKKSPCGGDKKKSPCKKTDPCGGAIKKDPCGSADNKDPCGSDKRKDPCGGDKNKDPCGGATKKDPCGSDKKKDPCGGAKKNDPCGGAKKKDPCGGAKKKGPCGSDKKKAPCGDAKKKDPCGGDKNKDPCGGAIKKDPCGGAEKKDPCGSKKKDPCGGNKKKDPCGGDKKKDPCGGAKKKDPCGGQKKKDPCGSKKKNPCGDDKSKSPCKKAQPKKGSGQRSCARKKSNTKPKCEKTSKSLHTTGVTFNPSVIRRTYNIPSLKSKNFYNFGFMRRYSSKQGENKNSDDLGRQSQCKATATKVPPKRKTIYNPHPKDGLRKCYPTYDMDCTKFCKDARKSACKKCLKDTEVDKRKNKK